MNNVIVVGGGWAGLSTAVELCSHGVSVTLIEASRQLGGRARCVAFDGDTVDNGQHLMIGAYTEALRLIALVHAPHSAPLARQALALKLFTQAEDYELRTPHLPAPLHLLVALTTARGLNRTDRWRALQCCVALAMRRFRLASDMSVAELLRAHAQSARLIECLWEPLCLATLNTPIASASAQIFLNVLHDVFTRRRSDCDLVFAATDLGNLFPMPALGFIEGRGGHILLGERVNALRVAAGRIDEVETAQMIRKARHVVLAAPAYVTQRLLASSDLLSGVSNNLAQLAYEPICTVYLRYPPQIALGTEMVGFTGTYTQWLIDRGHADQPGLMAAVISARGTHMDIDNDALTRHVTAEIARRYPHWPAPHESMVIREKRATFSSRVDIEKLRPTNETAIEGLWLAGDYTDTGYPATLEGAVRSGVACAKKIVARLATT